MPQRHWAAPNTGINDIRRSAALGQKTSPVSGEELLGRGELQPSSLHHISLPLSRTASASATPSKMSTGYLIQLAVLLVAVVNPGDGLACWVCSSDKMSEQYCKDPFNISTPFVYTRDCSDNLQQSTRPGYRHYCVKLVIKPQLGRPVTHRMCMWGPQFNPELELCSLSTSSVDDTIEQCHVCATTGCNGASRQYPPHPLGSALTLLGWLVLRS